jgi:hypothetical protein
MSILGDVGRVFFFRATSNSSCFGFGDDASFLPKSRAEWQKRRITEKREKMFIRQLTNHMFANINDGLSGNAMSRLHLCCHCSRDSFFFRQQTPHIKKSFNITAGTFEGIRLN